MALQGHFEEESQKILSSCSLVLYSETLLTMGESLSKTTSGSIACSCKGSTTCVRARPGEVPSDRPMSGVAVGAMISPKETFVYYRQTLDHLAKHMGREVQLVQRKTYREVDELIGEAQIDLAFVCSGPYVRGKNRYGLELLATPEVQGSHFYHSYLIANKDSPFQNREDLKGRVFAFIDPDSLTGRLVPSHLLAGRNA
jgi:phosphonate transport system substrate-binding protein